MSLAVSLSRLTFLVSTYQEVPAGEGPFSASKLPPVVEHESLLGWWWLEYGRDRGTSFKHAAQLLRRRARPPW